MSHMDILQEELIETSSWGLCSRGLQRNIYTDILHDYSFRFEDTKGNVIEVSELTEHSMYMVGIESSVWHAKSLAFVSNIAGNVTRDIDNHGYWLLTHYTEDIYDNGFEDIQDDIDPRDVSIIETIAVYVLARN